MIFFQINTTTHQLGLNYDYDSIMHYPSIAFSIDGIKKTIIPKKKGVILERKGLSEVNIILIY